EDEQSVAERVLGGGHASGELVVRGVSVPFGERDLEAEHVVPPGCEEVKILQRTVGTARSPHPRCCRPRIEKCRAGTSGPARPSIARSSGPTCDPGAAFPGPDLVLDPRGRPSVRSRG